MQLEESPRSDAHPRVFLQPIAAPSILGLYGLPGGIYGGSTDGALDLGRHTTLLLVPFRNDLRPPDNS